MAPISITPSCKWLVEGPGFPRELAAAVRFAHADIGEFEDDGNRGSFPDRVNREFGSPLGSAYCANAWGWWWKQAHLPLPPRDVGSCDVVFRWAMQTGRFVDPKKGTPKPGYGVLYGARGPKGKFVLKDDKLPDAVHIGILATTERGGWAIEANTTLAGFSRDGIAVLFKPVTKDRLLGYVAPLPLTP